MLAVGRLSDAVSGKELGTAFAVTDTLALTAFHCVGDRATGNIEFSRVRCSWGRRTSRATVQDVDPRNDIALLRLDTALPRDLEPVRLISEIAEHSPFVAPGAPAAVPGVPTYVVSGEVTWTDSRLVDGTSVIQLACHEPTADLPLAGLSGAPVLVGEPMRAAGIVRWNPPRDDRPELAAGGSVFAASVAAVLERWPQLHIATEPQMSQRTLVRRLAARGVDRNGSQVQDDIRQLLLTGGLGLREHDLDTGTTGGRHWIEVEAGCALIGIVIELRVEGAGQPAERWLDKQLADRDRRTERRYVGILTDGAEWHVYRRINAELRRIHTSLVLDAIAQQPDRLLSWLEALLATGKQIIPTPAEIVGKLGADSPAYAMDFAELTAIYDQCRDLPMVKVKRDIWAELLTTASGTHFTNDDQLFVNHTLLVAMAEVIGHAVLGFQPEDPALSAATVMSGELLSRAAIYGVIEADFFDWVAHVPGGDRFVKDLTRRLTRFEWGNVDHDILKVLYESIIPPEIRHQLGEYYTPDWLAEKIVTDCVSNPLTDRALDASCGSGTFLFHAIRRYLTAAEDAGRSVPEILEDVGRHVIGLDVHPVAVTLARVTYLLAIGTARLRESDRPAFTVPVYLADSLRWGKESTLWSDDGLRVPVVQDHQISVSDPALVGPSEGAGQLIFPDRVIVEADEFDRLVAELTRLATRRPRSGKVPTLTGMFDRFGIHEDDRPVLARTFRLMCELHDDQRNHIWGYYVRNLARPLWLKQADHRVDVLIGNPPWLAYRFMTQAQKNAFRAMSIERRLWAGGRHATHQDLSTLFVVRCIEQYLRPGGRFGYVVPWGTLSRGQYAGFRTGRYPVLAEPVAVAFEQPWDLHLIKPTFFPVPASVVFGGREPGNGRPVPLSAIAEVWSGELSTASASWGEVADSISRVTAEPLPVEASRPSPYMTRFAAGATVFPRFLFAVEPDRDPLGSGAGRRAVRSRRPPREHPPWRNLPSLRGTVEQEFIRPMYLGESILPFRCQEPVEALIPWDGQRLLHGEDERLDQYPGLAEWWRSAEDIWTRHRASDRLSLAERLDYHRGLVKQFPVASRRVVVSGSGAYLAAAVVTDSTAIIEHKLYWAAMPHQIEARYLTALLNSNALTLAVRPFQARGQHNPRDFDKHIFRLPIPLFDARDPTHKRLVALAERSEDIAANTTLPAMRFETQRRIIRQALEHDGVMAEIDEIVKKMLAQ